MGSDVVLVLIVGESRRLRVGAAVALVSLPNSVVRNYITLSFNHISRDKKALEYIFG